MVKRKGAKVGVVRVGGCKVFTEAQERGTRVHLPGEMVREREVRSSSTEATWGLNNEERGKLGRRG